MADAVPVSDVLCEAIEYLSKFGSNLRVRSDNLKEKRIRKDKLRNTHAVQKAASKVLLICELSKKSIENVENGVQKVLKQIKLSHESDGGISSYRSPKVEKAVDYEYIDYDSHRLRIRKKVDMKHFSSVKVLARSMPISMQDKYPVFYDCKMYRSRNKRKKFNKLDENISDEGDSTSSSLNKQSGEIECKDKTNDVLPNEHMECDVSESQSKALSKCLKRLSESDSERANDSQIMSEKEEIHSSTISEISSLGFRSKNNALESQVKASTINDQTKENTSSNIEQKIMDSQCDAEDAPKEDPESETKISPKIVLEQSPSKVNCNTKHKAQGSKKFRNIINVIDSGSDSDDDQRFEVNTEKKDFMDTSKKYNNKKSENSTKSTTENESDSNVSTHNSEKDTDTVSDKDSNQRPFIRCVSLDKLLKNNEKLKSNINEHQKSSPLKSKSKISVTQHDMLPNQNSDKKHRKIYSSKESSKKNEEYWIQKRNEIKQFKSKNFVIRVTRLPELSEKYLSAHNLNRITQNGSVICEVVKTKEVVENNEKHSQKGDTPIDITCAKNALLYDSDSDKSKDFEDTPRKVKRALLDDSESENDELPPSPQLVQKALQKEPLCKNDENTPSPGSPKNMFLEETVDNPSSPGESNRVHQNESLSEKSKNPPSPGLLKQKLLNDLADTPNKVKAALLNDSDSEKDTNSLSPGLAERSLDKESGSEKDEESQTPGPNNGEKDTIMNENQNSNSDQESRNNNTPEPQSANTIDDLKSALLCDSTDENNKTPSKKIIQNTSTPPSKRKHIMESMHAKKMLLTYSSSSDTEDEQLRNVLKEIRDSLLREHSGDESNGQKKHENERPKSDSEDSSVKDLKRIKNDKIEDSSENEEILKRKATVSEDDSDTKKSNSHIDENTEENSNSSFPKVRRK